MAIYGTRKRKIEQNMSYSLLAVFFNSVKSIILIDFRYFKAMNDLLSFESYGGALCEVFENNLVFAPILA